jgi:hypothetical protein
MAGKMSKYINLSLRTNAGPGESKLPLELKSYDKPFDACGQTGSDSDGYRFINVVP